jgi:hypothetical protein
MDVVEVWQWLATQSAEAADARAGSLVPPSGRRVDRRTDGALDGRCDAADDGRSFVDRFGRDRRVRFGGRWIELYSAALIRFPHAPNLRRLRRSVLPVRPESSVGQVDRR